jgi:hypothetical protein
MDISSMTDAELFANLEVTAPLPSAAIVANHSIKCDFPAQTHPGRLSHAKFNPEY